MFKYIIFDLDNTLYNYDSAHKIALTHIFNIIHYQTNISLILIKETYEEINKVIKLNLLNTSSCHSRILYFKKLIYNLNLQELFTANTLNDIYWDWFINNMKINENIIELLDLYKNNDIKLGIITNFTLEYQYKKLEKLNILHYFDVFISSEDTLFEKPHEYIFLKLKEECKCNSHEILIIGDSLSNDILPALRLNMNCCHLNLKQDIDLVYMEKYISFNNTCAIYTFWNELFKELYIYVDNCKRIGERYDLTQAGGGNISFKYKDLLIIKASGICISDISFNNGYSILNKKKLFIDFSNGLNNNLEDYMLFNTNNKPSIETFMHSFLKNITVHIHPLIFLRVLINNCYCFNNILKNYLLINYFEPGFELANEIYKKYKNENIVLLKNHGIIVTGNNFNEVLKNIDDITQKLEMDLNVSFLRYRKINCLDRLLNLRKKNLISYLSDDLIINQNIDIIINKSYFPDKVVYCGLKILFLENLDEIKKYKNENILIYDKKMYIISDNLVKCRQIEEIIKAHILITQNNNEINELTDKEQEDLIKRKDELYRKNLYK